MTARPSLLLLPTLALLAGCGETDTVPLRSVSQPVTATPRPTPGERGVIGADAAQLTAQFGPPRLDIREGAGRKLQWAEGPCVLDAYLYPPENAATASPRTTWVEARRPDGRDTDAQDCIAALRRAAAHP